MTTAGTTAGTAGGSRTTSSTAPPPRTFSSYVRERRPVLLRTARALTPNPTDAEDLLQTALTRTYVAWERIEDHGALDGYVRRALLNTRTSLWRKRRLEEFSCDQLPEPDPVPAPDPAERAAVHDAMWRAVLQLPARQRAMVVLRYYEDLSEARTAEVMGVSVGTVKSAVSRALAKLRADERLAADVLAGHERTRHMAVGGETGGGAVDEAAVGKAAVGAGAVGAGAVGERAAEPAATGS